MYFTSCFLQFLGAGKDVQVSRPGKLESSSFPDPGNLNLQVSRPGKLESSSFPTRETRISRLQILKFPDSKHVSRPAISRLQIDEDQDQEIDESVLTSTDPDHQSEDLLKTSRSYSRTISEVKELADDRTSMLEIDYFPSSREIKVEYLVQYLLPVFQAIRCFGDPSFSVFPVVSLSDLELLCRIPIQHEKNFSFIFLISSLNPLIVCLFGTNNIRQNKFHIETATKNGIEYLYITSNQYDQKRVLEKLRGLSSGLYVTTIQNCCPLKTMKCN
ncbi:hypothetical protein OSB04_011867 [Centaurea solstitialis]|uniref:Uncharacterized protein n=1 Tax=Centaurea solstitialis TaxID=347529 RepID=A0AA38THU9_9ASTR|nr:hypothetical protein OSB04_011867 [Centaurea solstitialis]